MKTGMILSTAAKGDRCVFVGCEHNHLKICARKDRKGHMGVLEWMFLWFLISLSPF